MPTAPKLPVSIQRLTRDFVNGLQADFPSTVPTIWRTADKISVRSTDSVTCDFCGYSFQNDSPPLSLDQKTNQSQELRGAMDALRISAQLSATLKVEDIASNERLCHSCRQMKVARWINYLFTLTGLIFYFIGCMNSQTFTSCKCKRKHDNNMKDNVSSKGPLAWNKMDSF